jgi:hypothetical protein
MRTLCFVVLFGLGAPALAQEGASPPQPAADVDEVVVPGRRPENLYAEIERLEGSVYERFNALNSNDELDIHCFKQAPTGSNIPLRRCAPNFVIEAEAQAAENTIVGGRSNDNSTARNAGDSHDFEQKSRALTEEFSGSRERRAARADLLRPDELKRLQENDKPARRPAGWASSALASGRRFNMRPPRGGVAGARVVDSAVKIAAAFCPHGRLPSPRAAARDRANPPARTRTWCATGP